MKMQLDDIVPGMYKLLFYGNGVATMNLGSECNMMFQHYFDGSNISELLSERSCKIRAAYINTDFSQYKHELENSEELSEFRNSRKYDCEITLVSWISEEAVRSNNFLSRPEYLENTDSYYDVPYNLLYKDNVIQK